MVILSISTFETNVFAAWRCVWIQLKTARNPLYPIISMTLVLLSFLIFTEHCSVLLLLKYHSKLKTALHHRATERHQQMSLIYYRSVSGYYTDVWQPYLISCVKSRENLQKRFSCVFFGTLSIAYTSQITPQD